MTRLVLADANPTVQRVVQLCFNDQRDEVSVFNDGNAALDHLLATGADLLLVDASLAGLDAFELCRRIKQNAAIRPIPVVLLVGARHELDPSLALEAGFDRQLSKPVGTQQLLALVEELMRETPAAPAGAAPSPRNAEAACTGGAGAGVIPGFAPSPGECHSSPPVYTRRWRDAVRTGTSVPPGDAGGVPVLLVERLVERLREELPRIVEEATRDVRDQG